LLDHGVGQVVFSLVISSSGSQLYRTTASPLFQSRSLGPSSGTGLKAPLHCRPTSHHHDGYEHTFRHTRFAPPPMPLVHCSFNPLKAGRWLGMTGLMRQGRLNIVEEGRSAVSAQLPATSYRPEPTTWFADDRRLAAEDFSILFPAMKSVIVGTAGHIDHGKTALVKALTGIDADRLEEEKRRGITIDIGFAHLELPAHSGEMLR